MSLDYEFSPIDVNITTHPKAFAAGVEAMGLWLWGMAFARQQKTRGRLYRSAVLGAWGGKRNIVLAKRLVDSGLWVSRDDGDWDVWNFEKKGAGRTTSSTERMRRLRAKRAGLRDDVTPDVTPCDANGDVTSVTSCSTSTSTSTSLSSGSGSQIASGEPPPWFGTVLDVIEMNVGEKLHPGEAWLRYRGHRSKKGEPISQHDAEYWLTTVMVRENRDAREETARRGVRDSVRDEQFRRDKLGVAPKPQDSRKTFRERDDWAKAAGPPDPETAERMKKLGVGS